MRILFPFPAVELYNADSSNISTKATHSKSEIRSKYGKEVVFSSTRYKKLAKIKCLMPYFAKDLF